MPQKKRSCCWSQHQWWWHHCWWQHHRSSHNVPPRKRLRKYSTISTVEEEEKVMNNLRWPIAHFTNNTSLCMMLTQTCKFLSNILDKRGRGVETSSGDLLWGQRGRPGQSCITPIIARVSSKNNLLVLSLEDLELCWRLSDPAEGTSEGPPVRRRARVRRVFIAFIASIIFWVFA